MSAVFTLDDDAPPPAVARAAHADVLARYLGAFRLHGRTTVAMVARLDGALDRLAGIPVEDWCRWQEGTARWVALRCGPLGRPPPPHLWPWRQPLAAWVTAGYPLAVRCRDAYLGLDAAGRRAARGRWGSLVGPQGGMDFSMMWEQGTPAAKIAALDERAERLRVRAALDARARALARTGEE